MDHDDFTSSGFLIKVVANPIVAIVPLQSTLFPSKVGMLLMHEDTSFQHIWLVESEEELIFEVKESGCLDRSISVETCLFLVEQNCVILTGKRQMCVV